MPCAFPPSRSTPRSGSWPGPSAGSAWAPPPGARVPAIWWWDGGNPGQRPLPVRPPVLAAAAFALHVAEVDQPAAQARGVLAVAREDLVDPLLGVVHAVAERGQQVTEQDVDLLLLGGE